MHFKKTLGGLVCLLVTCVLSLSQPVWASPDAPANQFNNEYTVPGAPFRLVVEAPGQLWFTMPRENMIGSLVISPTVTFTPYTIPTANSQPYDLLYDNGTIWFTELTGNKLGKLVIQTGAFQEFTIPTANSEPTGITLAQDGSLWFTERAGNNIGRFDPVTAAFSEYPYTSAGAKLEDIALMSNDNVWVTAPELNRVVNFDRTRNLFLDLFTGDQTRPWQILIDPSGTPWITTIQTSRIGRYTPGTLALWRWYELPDANSGAAGFTLQASDNQYQVWYTAVNNGGLGQLTTRPSGRPIALSEQQLPATNSRPHSIVVDTAGQVWVAATGLNKIIEWRAPYFTFTHLAVVSRGQ